ncbi:glycosyltransferase family 4 protein [Massilia sp. LXY-6]|uniref:glycosyltransferase family 4 protein n=1 Tax=Massilia sp. LXY-6 TaxID=3379823 RepID=UPI003EE3A9E8
MNHALRIVSLLDGNGPTGVEKHFNEILAQARAYDIDAELVSPHPRRGIWSKCANQARRLMARVSKEHAAVFGAWIESKVIESMLMKTLPNCSTRGRAITLYAQDPLSAKAALKVKARHECRVVIVIHYNVSIAEELLMKGEATINGPLWRLAVRTEQSTLPYVDQIIFVSDFMRQVALDRLPGLVNVSHTVIPNFIADPPSAEHPAHMDADVISIGTLEPRKNHAFLLHVIARTNSLGHRYTLTIVGNGPEEARLKTLACELGIASQVIFAGFRKNAARMIVRHRVLAHAAQIENMPITLIEALAAGRPILAPAVGGIMEIFDNATEGYHWPLDDVDAAAALLIKVLDDPDMYRQLSDAALTRYRSKFDGALLASHWLTTILNSYGPNHASWQKTWRKHESIDRQQLA